MKNNKTKAEELVRQEIRLRGPMPFSTFMDLALYHPLYGYYNQNKTRRGRMGDYFTSYQVSPLFGRIWAEVFLQLKEAMDCEFFSLIEVGAGDGELMSEVLAHLESQKKLGGMRFFVVERSKSSREKLFRKLSRFPRCKVVASLDDIEIVGSLEGCIFSNELFDALPFQRLKFVKSKWKEIFVDEKEGVLVDFLKDYRGLLGEDEIKAGDFHFQEGQEIEIRPQVSALLADWAQYFSRGFIVTVDYGYPRKELWDPVRPKGTWLCYRQHQTNTQPYEFIGDQDITSHLDFSHLSEVGKALGFSPSLYCSQGIFLSHTGQKQIEQFLKGSKAQANRSHISAVQQLVHPDAMGGLFKVLIQSKDVPLPEFFNAIPNRVHRLDSGKIKQR